MSEKNLVDYYKGVIKRRNPRFVVNIISDEDILYYGRAFDKGRSVADVNDLYIERTQGRKEEKVKLRIEEARRKDEERLKIEADVRRKAKEEQEQKENQLRAQQLLKDEQRKATWPLRLEQRRLQRIEQYRIDPRGIRSASLVSSSCLSCGTKYNFPRGKMRCFKCGIKWYANVCWNCNAKVDDRDPANPRCDVCLWCTCAVCNACSQCCWRTSPRNPSNQPPNHPFTRREGLRDPDFDLLHEDVFAE